MNTDKFVIFPQSFARVRLQLKFAFKIRPYVYVQQSFTRLLLL